MAFKRLIVRQTSQAVHINWQNLSGETGKIFLENTPFWLVRFPRDLWIFSTRILRAETFFECNFPTYPFRTVAQLHVYFRATVPVMAQTRTGEVMPEMPIVFKKISGEDTNAREHGFVSRQKLLLL